METRYCFLSTAPVRKEPSHTSEMVNQLLMGDEVEILDIQPEWVLTRSLFDDYKGWVSDKQLAKCQNTENNSFVVPADNEMLVNGITLKVPAGSTCNETMLVRKDNIQRYPITIAKQFLGSSYLWGGRTSMGIDCSGLTQVVFKICGIKLPRDASQQVDCGTSVDFENTKAGDLAFFANNEGRIVHVGIVAGNGTIIHASGMVRQDHLDTTGIYNSELGIYTHRLQDIRRIDH